MSSYGRNFSTRLFVQAAFTGFLAPMGAQGSAWLLVTFGLAAVAALLGAVVRGGHERTRELVIGFEAVAVAVGAVGLMGHHYIPGTIVGIAAAVTALNHPMPRAVAEPAQAADYAAPAPAPQFAAPAELFAAPAPASQFAAPVPVADPVVPATPVAGVRAMNILPGK
jgi:hypothetical protein